MTGETSLSVLLNFLATRTSAALLFLSRWTTGEKKGVLGESLNTTGRRRDRPKKRWGRLYIITVKMKPPDHP